MPPATKKSAQAKINAWCHDRFDGSGDIEKPDAVHLIDFLTDTYGGDGGLNTLTQTFERVKLRLQALDLTWSFRMPPVARSVPHPPAPGETESIRVGPQDLGFTDAHTEKGRSKMNYILEAANNFLEKPYDSITNPLWIDFSPESIPGMDISEYSIKSRIGFAKSLAGKLLLLGVIEANLTDEDVLVIQPCLQALFSMNATFSGPEAGEAAHYHDGFSALRKKLGIKPGPTRPDTNHCDISKEGEGQGCGIRCESG